MQPLHVFKDEASSIGERARWNPGLAMAVAVAWYGGLREMIYIYRLFVKFVVPTAGSDKRNPR